MDSMSVNVAVHDVHWGTWGGEARHLRAEGPLHAVCVPCVLCWGLPVAEGHIEGLEVMSEDLF